MEDIQGDTNPSNPPPASLFDRRDGKLFPVHVATSCFTSFLALLLCCIFLFTRGKNKTVFNRLYGNLCLGIGFSELLLRPGTILQSTPTLVLPCEYCTLMLFVLEMQTVMIPLMILMLIIERVIYIGDRCCARVDQRYRYWSRMSTLNRILTFTLPWFVSLSMAIIKTFGLLRPIVPEDSPLGEEESGFSVVNVLKTDLETSREGVCNMEWRGDEARGIAEVILYTFRSSFPAFYLVIASLFLASWWRVYRYMYRPQLNNIYKNAEHGISGQVREVRGNNVEETSHHVTRVAEGESLTKAFSWVRENNPDNDEAYELPAKPKSSVLVTVILSFMTVCVSVVSTPITLNQGWLNGNTQWLYFIIDTVAVVLPLIAFPEIRQKWRVCLGQCFCWMCKSGGQMEDGLEESNTSQEVVCEIELSSGELST